MGGGSLLDIGIYPLFLSYLILGKPSALKASATFGTTGVDEQCGMLLSYAGGQLALLESSLLAQTDTAAVIEGEKGQLYIHSRFHETKSLTLRRDGHTPTSFAFNRETIGYDYEAAHVMHCLAEGRTESNVWSLEDSLNLMALLDWVRAEAGIVYA